jgi:hypothetical protein
LVMIKDMTVDMREDTVNYSSLRKKDGVDQELFLYKEIK